MDEIGHTAMERIYDENGGSTVRVRGADPRIRISRELADDVRSNRNNAYAPWLTIDGDVLTIADDYGQRFIYRIHWDDYADGGYLAEWPD